MCLLGRCTNPTSDKGCSIWVMVGSAMATPTAPRQMMLYSCRGSTAYRFLYSCITPLHVPSVGTPTLQRLYSSTALYSALQLYNYSSNPPQYTVQPSTTPGSDPQLALFVNLSIELWGTPFIFLSGSGGRFVVEGDAFISPGRSRLNVSRNPQSSCHPPLPQSRH